MTGPLGFMGLVQSLGKKRPEIGEAHNPLNMAQQPLLAHLAPWGLHPLLIKSFPKPHWPQKDVATALWENVPAASLGPSGPWGLASNPDQQLSKASLAQLGSHSLPVELLAKSVQASGEGLRSTGVQIKRVWGLLCVIWAC